MWTALIMFILGFFKDLLIEQLNKPDNKVIGNYTGKVTREKVNNYYNANNHIAKYERLFNKD